MRFILPVLLIVFLFNSDVLAQTEIAREQFEQGLTNAHQNRFEQALKDFQTALEKYKFADDLSDEFAAKINYNIGVCLYRSGRTRESVAYLQTAIKLAKNEYGRAFHALGVVESELGNRRAAKKSFASAVRRDKGDGESWFDLAFEYLREKDLTNAAAAFQKAILYRSVDAATAHNNLGVMAAISGDWQEAKKQFETALATSGGNLPEAKRNLEICRTQKNFSRALVAKLEFVNRKNEEN